MPHGGRITIFFTRVLEKGRGKQLAHIPAVSPRGSTPWFDILPALKREDSHGTVPLGWDIVVYDVACS